MCEHKKDISGSTTVELTLPTLGAFAIGVRTLSTQHNYLAMELAYSTFIVPFHLINIYGVFQCSNAPFAPTYLPRWPQGKNENLLDCSKLWFCYECMVWGHTFITAQHGAHAHSIFNAIYTFFSVLVRVKKNNSFVICWHVESTIFVQIVRRMHFLVDNLTKTRNNNMDSGPDKLGTKKKNDPRAINKRLSISIWNEEIRSTTSWWHASNQKKKQITKSAALFLFKGWKKSDSQHFHIMAKDLHINWCLIRFCRTTDAMSLSPLNIETEQRFIGRREIEWSSVRRSSSSNPSSKIT